MLGSLIGDLTASRYISGMRPEDEDLLNDECELTAGALLTVCAMKAITESEGETTRLRTKPLSGRLRFSRSTEATRRPKGLRQTRDLWRVPAASPL